MPLLCKRYSRGLPQDSGNIPQQECRGRGITHKSRTGYGTLINYERKENMDENYILSVTGKQTVDGQSDKIELQTPAAYMIKNGTRYITYKEYDASCPDRVFRTTVKVDQDGIVTIMKGGTEKHHLILEKGVRHKCEYVTSFGSLSLGIYTESVRNNLNDNGGELEVCYSIDIGAELASTNELHLKIKEA